MIYVVDGKIGGGKSLFSLLRMLDTLSRGGFVQTNLLLKKEQVDKYMFKRRRRIDWASQYLEYDFEADPDFFRSIKVGTKDVPSLVVCDEAHLVYEAGNHHTNRQRLKNVASWLSQSRKFHCDHLFVAQDISLLWPMICKQAEHRINCIDMRKKSMGKLGKMPGATLRYYEKDIKSGLIQKTGSSPVSMELFDCYDSYQKFDEAMRELEASLETHDLVDTALPTRWEQFIEWGKEPLLPPGWWRRFRRAPAS